MPDVYPAGTPIAELGGTFDAGTTVVVHEPGQVDDLVALCELSGALAGTPIRAIREALPAREPLDLAQWGRRRRVLRRTMGLPADAPRRAATSGNDDASPREEDEVEALVATLEAARDIWLGQGAEMHRIALALTVSDTDDPGKARVAFTGTEPVLALTRGSIDATLALELAASKLWMVSLFVRGGPAPTVRGQALVRKLRAERLAAARHPLESLEDLAPAALAKAHGLVVFVHGLLSTDVGTFDAVMDRLGGDLTLHPAGFAHDTLLGITDNAHALRRLLRRHAATNVPVVLVCHSRGGLVARRAIADLMAESPRGVALSGCVTFGTPHEGCALAEWPRRMIGTAVSLMALSGSRAGLSLVDVAAVCKGSEALPGVTDLQPVGGAGSTFLRTLEEAEMALRPDGLPAIPLMAVGGRIAPHTRAARFRSHLLGDDQHDAVVPLASSLPAGFRGAVPCVETAQDHFGYFDAAVPANARVLDEAAAFVKRCIAATRAAHAEAVRAAAAEGLKGPITVGPPIKFRKKPPVNVEALEGLDDAPPPPPVPPQ